MLLRTQIMEVINNQFQHGGQKPELIKVKVEREIGFSRCKQLIN